MTSYPWFKFYVGKMDWIRKIGFYLYWKPIDEIVSEGQCIYKYYLTVTFHFPIKIDWWVNKK